MSRHRRIAFVCAAVVPAIAWSCGEGIFDHPPGASSLACLDAASCPPEGDARAQGRDADVDANGLDGALAVSCDGQAPGTWRIELVDGRGDTGRFPSVVVGADGVHVSYYDVTTATVRYARRTSSGWAPADVDVAGRPASGEPGNVGMGTSIRLDAAGRPAIAYSDIANGHLKLARQEPGGAWALETADGATNVGGWPSLVLDDVGAHVTYFDSANRLLKAAHRDLGGTWTNETVDGTVPSVASVGQQSSLAVDAAGGLHVTYSENQAYLKYATRPRSGSWSSTRIDSLSSGLWSSLVIDRSGNLHVAGCSRFGTGDLHYAQKNGLSWPREIVETQADGNVGWSASLAVDDRGEQHIVYFDKGNGDLRYAHRAAATGAWEKTTLDAPGTPPDLGRYAAMVVDRSRILHAVYYDPRSADLQYARRCP
jgi:hypothetical protein